MCRILQGILMMSMGYYFKGDAAKLAATHAPFSAGEAKQLAQVYDTLEKKQRSHADNIQRARGRRVAHVRHQEHTRMQRATSQAKSPQAKHMQKATAVSSR
jgi:DNA-binding transcriptional regulator YbjK